MNVQLHSKYVMLEPANLPGCFVPVLLPQCIEHKVVTALGKPRSAGFVRVNQAAQFGVETFGFSTGLNLSPHPDDAKLIALWHADLVFARPLPFGAEFPASSVIRP